MLEQMKVGLGTRVWVPGWKRRGFADWKMVIAAAFALGGIGAAGWVVFGGEGGEAKPVEVARETTTTVDADGNEAVAEYRKTKGSDAAVVVGELAGLAMDAARAIDGFGTQGPGSGAALGESVELAIGSFVSGDHDAFLAAMAALGGTLSGELDGEHPLFERLKAKLSGAKVDLTRLEVRAHESRRGGAMMRSAPRVQDGEGEDEGEGPGGQRNINQQVMEMQPASLFGDAAANVDERAVDVRFPFLARGADDEEWFGVVLVWNGEVGKWQPGAFQLIQREVTVMP